MDPLPSTTNTTSPTTSILRIGTRNSELALKQTQLVRDQLHRHHPQLTITIVPMTTTGDQILDAPLHQIGTKALFTKELEVALLDGRVDLVVHSCKDVPTTLPQGLRLGAVCPREDARDVVVMRQHWGSMGSTDGGGTTWKRLQDLPASSVVGTSSVRRIAQLRHYFPHLHFRDIRGNLNTRLRKLDDPASPYACIVLAYAGLARLGWTDRISQVLEPLHGDVPFLYAPGQGVMALECRSEDLQTLALLAPLNDRQADVEVTAERTLMRTLEGGCSVPIGVACQWLDSTKHHQWQCKSPLNLTEDAWLELRAIVCAPDGSSRLEARHSVLLAYGASHQQHLHLAQQLGAHVAQQLVDRGARSILEQCRPKLVGIGSGEGEGSGTVPVPE